MKPRKKFNPYEPIFVPIGVEPVFEGELHGLSHEAAKKEYEQHCEEGWFDDYD